MCSEMKTGMLLRLYYTGLCTVTINNYSKSKNVYVKKGLNLA